MIDNIIDKMAWFFASYAVLCFGVGIAAGWLIHRDFGSKT
jgi:hypothetical protein